MDFEALWREYPPAPDFFDIAYKASRDELTAIQEERFLLQVARGWEIPFYRRHWSAAGLEPGDICRLDDLQKIPPYDVHDLRKSIERAPPWGDYIGLDPQQSPMPLVLQSSGGTTGLPRPMIYSPRDREVMNILNARRLYMQGVRPYDVVQVALSMGLSNGGLSAREAIWKYTGAIPVMTGSGASTPTRRQIEIMQAWKVNHLAGFPAYIRHLALVARDELDIDPRSLGLKSLLVHLGVDSRDTLEALWGADAYDCYGTNECGCIAADCAFKTGMHVNEDAFVVEVVDPAISQSVPNGTRGTVYLTSLFKYLAPVIRYNVNDVSAYVKGDCPCGSSHRRLERLFGRSDNMIKLRGVNVFPEAIGEVIGRDQRCNGEYVCLVDTVDDAGRDELTVMVEGLDASLDRPELSAALQRALKDTIGLKMKVEVVSTGELDQYTGLSQSSKIKRVLDRRNSV